MKVAIIAGFTVLTVEETIATGGRGDRFVFTKCIADGAGAVGVPRGIVITIFGCADAMLTGFMLGLMNTVAAVGSSGLSSCTVV